MQTALIITNVILMFAILRLMLDVYRLKRRVYGRHEIKRKRNAFVSLLPKKPAMPGNIVNIGTERKFKLYYEE